ncbi:MAG: UDP-2,3-diacylglucosamine diphosphatase [candidate division WOR-3 bacterium]
MYYFISDVHLGIPNSIHQDQLITFLQILKDQTENKSINITLFILGDLFEFWTTLALTAHNSLIENNVVIKELLKLKAFGVKIYFLPGNHDYHLKEILKQKFGFTILDKFYSTSLNDKKVFIGHGEEINPSFFSKLTLKIYRSKILLLLFYSFGSHLAITISKVLSAVSSRLRFQTGLENRFLDFAHNKITSKHYNIVILGHTHKPRLEKIEQGYYLNTGDWISNFSYGVLSQNIVSLKKFSKNKIELF